jgi:hypothetical protein
MDGITDLPLQAISEIITAEANPFNCNTNIDGPAKDHTSSLPPAL